LKQEEKEGEEEGKEEKQKHKSIVSGEVRNKE